MDLNFQKERFSNAYVMAIASVAGLQMYKQDPDIAGIDWVIGSSSGEGTIGYPRFEFQLKCTSKDIVDDAYVKYALDVPTYNKLRGTNVSVPRLLVVVTVPESINEWLDHSEEQLVIRHCAYWVSLYGSVETENRETITIKLPRSNLFNVEGVKGIVQSIRDGGKP
jgi:hypothetical protein